MYVKYSRWSRNSPDSDGNCVYERGHERGLNKAPLIGEFDSEVIDPDRDCQVSNYSMKCLRLALLNIEQELQL